MSVAAFIKKQIITEKAHRLESQGQYVFRVSESASKPAVKSAVEKQYKVHVRSVNVVNLPSKPKHYRGRLRHKSGYRKAIVSLRPGETINL